MLDKTTNMDISRLLKQAERDFDTERWSNALRSYDRILAIDPESQVALIGRVRTLLCLGRTPEASSALSRFDPVSNAALGVQYHLAAGVMALRDGKTEIAEVHYRDALLQDPDSLDALAALAWALQIGKKEAESDRVLTEAILRFPRSSELLTAKAMILAQRGRSRPALTEAVRALRISYSSYRLALILRLLKGALGPAGFILFVACGGAMFFPRSPVTITLTTVWCGSIVLLVCSQLWLEGRRFLAAVGSFLALGGWLLANLVSH